MNHYRDLCVLVDTKLKFHKHVRSVVGKAGGMIGNLLRSTICRSEEFMFTLFVTHIRPIIDYCSTVWNVGYLEDMRKLESLQRRWTREVSGMRGLEYVVRLRNMRLYSVAGRLLRADLVKIWKSFCVSPDVGLSSIFQRATMTSTRGHHLKLSVPICHGEVGRRFAVRRVLVWNSIPQCIVDAPSYNSFKRQLDIWLGDRLFEVV